MKGSITISRPSYGDGRELIVVQIRDGDSGERFLDVEIGYNDYAKLITGQSEIPCDLKVRNLDHVGKVRETDTIEFPFSSVYCDNRDEKAIEEAKKYTPDGWICDNYFGSQTSFFSKDDTGYAKATIRRWIVKEQ